MHGQIEGGAAPGEAAMIGKISRRLLWFLFLLYMFSFLDRINIGFAALSMNRSLGLSATAFGLASTVFYVGYVACEIPSNLLLVRYGARRWLARIMVTWGIISAGTMLVDGARELYIARFLLGIAEAGFAPGVLLYLTTWFPPAHRGRANGLLMVAQPVAMALGASVSGLILQMDGIWGLQGWRWLFLIEGLPSVVLGFVTWFYLTDRPGMARWLSGREKTLLAERLDEEAAARPTLAGGAWRTILQRDVLLLCVAYFCLVNSLNAISTWLPQIVRQVLAARSLAYVGFVSALPAAVAAVVMLLWGFSSDRHNERGWHTVAALALTAIGWVLVIIAPLPELRLFGLVCATSGAFSAMVVFWPLPPRILFGTARAVGLALISSVGLMGSAVSPAVIGFLRDLTGGFTAGLLYITALLVVSMVLVIIVNSGRGGPARVKATSDAGLA